MHGQFAFCCDCQLSKRRNAVLIPVVIIFQSFNNHMIFDNELKRTDRNASSMIIESVNYKKMNPMTA